MRNFTCLLIVAALAVPALAQHDFLTTTEADRVRDVQEPVARIKLYILFARQRLDQVQSLLAKNRPGRSGDIRQLLEDYTSIVDAMGAVADDAVIRKTNISLAPPVMIDGEKKFLDQLTKIQSSAPTDLGMYDFELKEAIEATSGAIETASENPAEHDKEVAAKVAEQKKTVEAVNAAERKAGIDPTVDKAKAAIEAEEAEKPARQAPTLYRPGEKEALENAAQSPKKQ